MVGVACLAAAAVLLLFAARGSLWFDEVWSAMLTPQLRGPWDVFRLRFDNNHLLNTMYLWALGLERPYDLEYRLLSVLSGIGAFATLGWMAGRGGRSRGVAAIILAGSSFPLVLYFSEARGYGPAMFCAVLAFGLVRERWAASGVARVIACWGVLMLGILSHLTFVLPTLALAAGAVFAEVRRRAPVWRGGMRLVWLFGVPLAFYVWLYVVFVRDLQVLGGPVSGYREVAETTAAMLLGMPARAPWGTVALVAYLAVVCAGCVAVGRRSAAEGVFHAVALALAPVALVAATRPELLYFRYFIVVFPFFPFLLAELLGSLCRERAMRWGVAGLVVVGPWVVGHGQRIESLLRFGRGDERGLLRRVSAESPPGEVRVGCDNETGLMLDFYARDLPPDQTLVPIASSRWSMDRPEWFVTRTYQRRYHAPPEMTVGETERYRRLATFRHGGVSGWTSFLWRRDPQPG